MAEQLLPVFAICLDREMERKKLLIESIGALGLKVEFVGVDGRNLPSEFQDMYSGEMAKKVFGRELGVAEVGCYASHITVWRKMVEKDIDYALVVESDAILTSHSMETIRAILASNAKWDLVQLSWWACIPSFWGRVQLDTGNKLVRFSRKTYRASAYLLTRAGALELLKHSQAMVMPLDHMMFTGKVKKHMSIYGVYPRCVELLSNNMESSSLREERERLSGKEDGVNYKHRSWIRAKAKKSDSAVRHFFQKIWIPPKL